MQNLTASIAYHAARHPQATAVIFGTQKISYADFLDRIERLSGWLQDAGVKADGVAALVMKNSPAFLEIAFAVSHLGGVFLPVNYRLSPLEVSYIAQNAGAQLVFVDAELEHLAADISARVVTVTPAMQSDIRRLTGTAGQRGQAFPRGPNDLFRLMYTSGTTDRPKGVPHSYANEYWKCLDHVMDLRLSWRDVLCIVGPLYHVGAFDLPGIAVLWMGGTLTVIREYSPETVLRTIERDRATGIWMAPIMTNGILHSPERDRYDVSSLGWCIAGGDRTPESRIRAFGTVFRNARYVDAYGLTETCSGDTLMEAGREFDKIGSVGRATAHVQVEVRDEAGTVLPSGEAGEICLRGAKITQGYWQDPVRTEASFWPGGWFRSGDIGYLDAEGFLYLTERKKDLIISGGENIASSEVERVIYELPQVSEAAVIARPDPKWGDLPVAVVVLKQDTELDYQTLAAHCRGQLAGFKVPKELHIVETLPRNPSGKVLKRVLRDRFAETDRDIVPLSR